MAKGAIWWIHRDESTKDIRFDAKDYRHHFRRGFVVEKSEAEFVVELPAEGATGAKARSVKCAYLAPCA